MNLPHFFSKICGIRLKYKYDASLKLKLYSQIKTFSNYHDRLCPQNGSSARKTS